MDDVLSTLARADAARLKAFAETLLPALGDVEVMQSRSGLVMLPMRDTAQGVAFHLGEVLVSEAHIRAGAREGYGMRRGHDLEASMAMALVDLAMATGVERDACDAFCAREADALAAADTETLRSVEATRVNMETF
ncbi:MAG: phosphonate C-P lyase system protein PhnG [Pseudomonadota bacterium]